MVEFVYMLLFIFIDYAKCKESSDFPCYNGQCIPIEYKCDSKKHCIDGSDEIACGKFTISTWFVNYN